MHPNICGLIAATWMSNISFGMDPGPGELLGELGGDEVDDLLERIAPGAWGFFATSASSLSTVIKGMRLLDMRGHTITHARKNPRHSIS